MKKSVFFLSPLRPMLKGFQPLGKTLAVLLLLAVGIPNTAWADPYEMGLKLYTHGDYAMAARYFREATGRDGDNPNAHYYLADCYLKLNRPADTQAEYLKIIAIAPDTQAGRLARLGLSRLRTSLSGNGESGGNRWSAQRASLSDAPDRYQGEPAVGEDYLDAITEEGRLVRWSLRKMPLKVYIEESPQGIRNFQPAFISQVRRALNVWSGVLNHQLSYVPVRSPEQADIRVTWTNTIDTRGHGGDGRTAYTAGLMIPHIRHDSIEYMEIKIATFDIRGNPQNSDTVYAVSLHELGHSLGLLGHSDDNHDVMYGENQHVITPSRRDMNTLRRLYGMPADIDNTPATARLQNPGREAELTAALDKSIVDMEARAERDNMALTYLNLGVVYFQKAKQTTGKDSGDGREWYEKSLKSVNRAIQMEPRDPRAYHKRSLVEQELGRFSDALSSIQTALTLDPKEPEYHLLQAWFFAKLDRKSEARGALDAYLLYKPGDAGSEDVRRIQKQLSMNKPKS